MDETQLRFLTTQSLYGKDLQERNIAIRQLQEGDLSDSDIVAIHLRLGLALGCQDEYVRSAAAMLLASLAARIPVSQDLAKGLLSLSCSADAFPRESALRAIKAICEEGRCLVPQDAQALSERLEEARRVESEGFALSLFDEE